MLTFREFNESQKARNEEKALDVVRRGVNLTRREDFWSEFLSLCGNADGMASLLDVPREKVTALHGRITSLIEKASGEDTKKKDKLIKTGGKT